MYIHSITVISYCTTVRTNLAPPRRTQTREVLVGDCPLRREECDETAGEGVVWWGAWPWAPHGGRCPPHTKPDHTVRTRNWITWYSTVHVFWTAWFIHPLLIVYVLQFQIENPWQQVSSVTHYHHLPFKGVLVTRQYGGGLLILYLQTMPGNKWRVPNEGPVSW